MLGSIFSKPNSDFRPVFVVGTGRCGTHLMYELFNQLKLAQANHILDLDGDSFYRYFKWYDIPVDTAGFFDVRDDLIKKHRTKLYVESNPYLSFHVADLYQKYNARFIFLVRDARDVVRSHVTKGWYEREYQVENPVLPLGYQYGMKTNHFLGRIVPQGEEYARWKMLTRIGRISWMWQRVNLRIQKDFEKIPDTDKYFLKVEDLDLQVFNNILGHFNINTTISQQHFDKIIYSRPGKSVKVNKEMEWSELEQQEFQNESREGRELFGY